MAGISLPVLLPPLPLPAGEGEDGPVAGLDWLGLVPIKEQSWRAGAEAGAGEAL